MKSSIAILNVLLAGFAALWVQGCASAGVAHRSLDRERPLTLEFDSDDARRTVDAMVDSLLADPVILELAGEERPILDLAELGNATATHVDTRMLTHSMRTKLLRTQRFRFVDRSQMGEDLDMVYQDQSGLVDPDKAFTGGTQETADWYLYGQIFEVRDRGERVIDRYYMVSLNLRDRRSGEIIWSDTEEIRKEKTRARVGL